MAGFTLTIDMGNEAMQDSEDVAQALGKVITQLAGRPSYFDCEDSMPILDGNGNTVGEWEYDKTVVP